jgi:hypothetical protein
MPETNAHDPRDVLKREKYFSLRPKPLEQWLWRQGIPPSAERVFWLHWQEGMRNTDWCSEIPLRRVAQQCCLDVSTVTRAYQALTALGLLRRLDPGRDPANPFQQATAITEVRVPRELLVELNRHPNRPPSAPGGKPATARAADPVPAPEACVPTPTRAQIDPFSGLSLKQRLRALAELTSLMSAGERRQFNEAQRLHTSAMSFDEASGLNAEQRGRVLQWLEICALKPSAAARPAPAADGGTAHGGPRKLTTFDLLRLRRELHLLMEPAAVPERLREVIWSIEEGALQRFQPLHAIRIALKKIREGLWTRPNRMPPHWVRALAGSKDGAEDWAGRHIARLEPCQSA